MQARPPSLHCGVVLAGWKAKSPGSVVSAHVAHVRRSCRRHETTTAENPSGRFRPEADIANARSALQFKCEIKDCNATVPCQAVGTLKIGRASCRERV